MRRLRAHETVRAHSRRSLPVASLRPLARGRRNTEGMHALRRSCRTAGRRVTVAVPLFVRRRRMISPRPRRRSMRMSPAQRKLITLVVDYRVNQDSEPLAEVEAAHEGDRRVGAAARTVRRLGVSVADADAATLGYAIKRLAVTAQGQNVAARIVSRRCRSTRWRSSTTPARRRTSTPSSPTRERGRRREVARSKKIRRRRSTPSLAAVAERVLSTRAGARRRRDACVRHRSQRRPTIWPSLAELQPRAGRRLRLRLDRARRQCSTPKATRSTMPVLTFVRGEDLRTIVVPRGDARRRRSSRCRATATTHPRRIDAAGERDDHRRRPQGRALPHRRAAGEAAVRHHRRAHGEAGRERDEGSDRASPRSAASRSKRSSAITRRTRRTRNRSSRATSRATRPSCASHRPAAKRSRRRSPATTSPIRAAVRDWVWQDFFINGVSGSTAASPSCR